MPLEVLVTVHRRQLCELHADLGPDEFDFDCPDCKTGAQLQQEGNEPDEVREN